MYLVEEAQLAHGEVFAERKSDAVFIYQAELEHLLSRLEMLPHLVGFKVLAAAANHGAGFGRITQFALVTQRQSRR